HLALVKCPAGLELGSETLPEIALSVMAEITRLRRRAPEKPKLNVLEKSATASTSESIDPVCGMSVATANARYKTEFQERSFYFCCLRCKETFERSPETYLETAGGL
ncbi:MAG TPA: YHS domain-containing protein, partial [Vicinamibacteria bacterium]